MATRISYQFPTRYGETYRVDLDDVDHVGASLEVDAATDGFTLRYDGETDSVNPGIVGSSCSVSMLVTPDNKTAIETLASDIISSGEDRFTIAIYRITAGPTVSLYWAGYLVPDLGGFEDSSEGYFFTVKAVDGLARLKTLDYKDTTPNPDAPYGYDEFVDHIIRVINAVGTSALYWDATDVFLRTVVNWKDGNMPAPTAAKDPLKYSRISGGVFAKKVTKDDGDAWDWTSYYTVLEQICRHWGARFMLSNGAWRFEQVRERMEENFFERRWANDNTLLSSTNAAGYDAPVIQTGSAHRLAGGQFNYLPALKKVEVNYDHKTYKNRLENLNYKWYKDSGSNTPFAETGMSFDADTYFRVRGNLFVNVSVSSYTEPWRYVFGIILKTTPGNYTLDSQTTAVGQGVPTLNRELPNWQVASVYYEVSTPWIYSTSYVGVIPNEFAFFTPYIPASQTGFSIDFSTGLGGRDYDGNNVSVTLNDWRFSNLELAIQGLDTAANYEKARSYTANNSTTGNSDAIKIDAIFGHAVKSWTPGKVQTTNDDTFVTWTDTTATWERANENTTYEFGDILAYQTLQLQLTPVQTYSGTLLAAAVHAHSRVTLADNTTWLINRGEWQARNNTWAVEMMLTGVADGADIDSDTPVGNPDDGGLLGTAPPGFNVAPGSGSGTLTAVGYEGRAALNFFTFSTISTHVGAGTITSIPVSDPIKGNTIFDNDVIYVLDPQSGIVTKFVVNGDVADGATSITVDSQAINTPLPIGAQVIPSLYNIYTNSNGTGTPGTPSGTAEGQILVWDNVNSIWEPYSGGTDGHVLTWDTTNGWQAEAAASGGGDILDGGNTTGATVIIGTNDANALQFETNNVTRINITGGASTGGAVTITDITANTSTPENVLTLIANSNGTALAGLGPAILFQAESSTTDSTDAARIFAAWLTATHASRASKIAFEVVNAASTIEIASFDATNSGAGRLLIGASSPAVYSGTGITTAANYTVGGSSSSLTLGGSGGAIVVSTSSTKNPSIDFTASANGATNSGTAIRFLNTTYTQTSNTRNIIAIANGFAPTSGTAVHNQLVFNGTFNQTGGANGITRGIYLNQTLSAVADFRALEISANTANAKALYITGASSTSNIVGATAFGTTSNPDASAIVDIVSTAKGLGLPAMTTTERDAISSPRDGLAIYNTTLDTLDLRANGAWVSLGTGSGTVTGTGTANHVAYWSGTSALTGESAFYYDPTNDRLGLNQSSPQKRLSIKTADATDGIRIESDGTLDQDSGRIELMGTATGPYVQRGFIKLDVYSNAGASSDGQALLFQLQTDSGTLRTPMSVYTNQAIFNNSSGFTLSNNAGRLRFQASSAGIFNTDNNWLLTTSAQTTNDANSRLKIVSIGTTSSNYGLRVYNSTPTLIFAVRDDQAVGINVDPADATLQVKGLGTTTAKTLLVENSSGTDNFYVQDNGLVTGQAFQNNTTAPTISYAAGAGTGPTTDILVGGNNCALLLFTTGTSPSASDTVFTLNLNKSFANGCAASWVAYNAATQPIIGNFWLSGVGNNSITVKYAGTLAASTQYGLSITIIGY